MEPLAKTKEPFRKNLSEHLKRYRKLRNWDQHDLAAAVGLTAGGIRGYEQQARFPKPEELQKLADVLQTSPGKLLEDPETVEQAPEKDTSREALLVALFEKAIHLDKDGLATAIEAIKAPQSDELAKANARIRELEEKLAAIEEADQLIEDTEEMLGDRETKPKTRKKSD